MQHISWRTPVRDFTLILVGSAIFAVGLNCFEVPNGLAAGGITGAATIIQALGQRAGVNIPIGLQTIAVNALLLVFVARRGTRGYMVRTVLGILLSGLMTDLLAPVLPVLGGGDLLLSALWGGVITGIGLGLVFRTGGNTGGTDIIAQFVARRMGVPVGTAFILVDGIIVAASAPVFSIENALYAAVAMYICGKVVDMVVDGMRAERCAYIISSKHDEISKLILYNLDRGCTELQARGSWSGTERPMLMCVLGRSETALLKELVAQADPNAIVIISEVYEAFGEGFKPMD